MVALVSAVVMLAICVIQVAVWRRAMASWLGKRVQDLPGEKQLMDRAPGVVPGGPGCSADHHGGERRSWLVIGLGCSAGGHPLFVLAAQVLAGVQFLRPSGPPGTLPAHIRRLKVRSRYRNE